MSKKTLFFILLLVSVLLGWQTPAAYAQRPPDQTPLIDWRELKTENFIIVYAERIEVDGEEIECACGIEKAEQYADFVDEIYHSQVTVFETELKTPISLRLFPTEESYYEVNPIAELLTGVIAHALNNREEIAIALPRTKNLSKEELQNNIRHELAHLFASSLSGGKLTAGFQEGIAQYLEKPISQSGYYDPALLAQALEQERLLTWAELDDAQQVYSDPQVAYPQTLSIVSFLVDRYGFFPLVEFIKATTQEPGYRSALEVAYEKPADELEAEWLAYLPDYLDGRWQINALYAYDLSRVTELVTKGAYTDAETELTEIIALLESTDQTDRLTEAESLLAQAHQGQAANALADEARSALETGDYPVAISKGQAALTALEALDYQERISEVRLYIYRAELGQDALNRLHYGEQLLNSPMPFGSLGFFEVEHEIYEATVLLQRLNNQEAAQRGLELLNQSVQQQSLIAYLLLATGLGLLLVNGLRRAFNWFSANPLEVEFR